MQVWRQTAGDFNCLSTELAAVGSGSGNLLVVVEGRAGVADGVSFAKQILDFVDHDLDGVTAHFTGFFAQLQGAAGEEARGPAFRIT